VPAGAIPAPTANAALNLLRHEHKFVSGPRLLNVCQQFGLTLSPIRPRIDEALGLIMPGQPVLLDLEGAEGPALVAIHNGDRMTVRVDFLSESESLTLVVSHSRAQKRFSDWQLKAATESVRWTIPTGPNQQ
jgi:hypothetical protein